MPKASSATSALNRRQRQISLWVLLCFCVQAMYAQGTMAGAGTWAELCSADTGSLQVIYLGNSSFNSFADNSHILEHTDTQDCSFSAAAFGLAQTFEQVLLGNKHFTPELYRSLELQASLYTRRLARAPPATLA